jgi:hypothetical protein
MRRRESDFLELHFEIQLSSVLRVLVRTRSFKGTLHRNSEHSEEYTSQMKVATSKFEIPVPFFSITVSLLSFVLPLDPKSQRTIVVVVAVVLIIRLQAFLPDSYFRSLLRQSKC